MSTIQALREKRAQIVADMEAVLDMAASEGRDLNQEETELFEAYQADMATVDKQIERRAFVDGQRAALDRVEPARTSAQGAGEAGRVAPEAKREFGSLGEFMGAVVSHYRDHRDDPRLHFDESAGMQASEQNMGDGASGGFLVPTQFRDTLLRVEPQEAIIEGRSNVMEAGSPPDAAVTMPAIDQTGDAPDNVYGGVEVSWIGEGDTKPQTKTNLREIEIRPHELAAHVQITDKLLRNAPAFSGQIEMLMRQALIGAKERAFLNGDGVAKPQGLLTAGATIDVNRAGANAVAYADVTGMVGKLLMRGGMPYWLASQSVYPQIAGLQSPEGHLIWQENAVDGSPGSLMGYPVFWHERSPLLGARGDLMLVNTNPYYIIKPGSGPFVAMGYAGDDFIQNRTRVKCFLNVDAQPWLTAPFTQEGGYEVSPFIALDVPS